MLSNHNSRENDHYIDQKQLLILFMDNNNIATIYTELSHYRLSAAVGC